MSRVLIYLLRRDTRLADNPVFHEIARLHSQSHKPFSHLIPLYVFPAEQIEVSGFLSSDAERSPYKDARSSVSGFWRCGRLRAKFIAESVWDLKKDLESIGSGLVIRVGAVQDAVRSILDGFKERSDVEVHGVWMTGEEGWEEQQQEKHVKKLMEQENKEFELFPDDKYYINDKDLPFKNIKDLSDIFTSFRKTVEPLRAAVRQTLDKPESLPPLPEQIPDQSKPFEIPDSLDGLVTALWKPIAEDLEISGMPTMPSGVESAHPFSGGSAAAHARVRHLIESGAMTRYKDTRNGLLGLDFSTKLSAWLAIGSITSRQIHWMMMDFEDGLTDLGKDAPGYRQGENKGTASVRFELLWRDYMRLCTRKFGSRLFLLDGFRQEKNAGWKLISSAVSQSSEKKNKGGANDEDTRVTVERFLRGQTGIGLIDASQREVFLTGWTSNRARQNVASFLAKHLGIDWRIGAEWYEANLIDYDVSSNWGNWQYVAGVGNDPRGDARVFNPVKQALDYDPNGDYIRAWVPELRRIGETNEAAKEGEASKSADGAANKTQMSSEALMGIFQAWRLPEDEKKRLGLDGVEWAEKPLKRIEFSINRRGGGSKRGGGGGGGGRGNRGRGRGRGRGGGGREARSGPMEKAGW